MTNQDRIRELNETSDEGTLDELTRLREENRELQTKLAETTRELAMYKAESLGAWDSQ